MTSTATAARLSDIPNLEALSAAAERATCHDDCCHRYAETSTRVLIVMNRTYLKEFMADPSVGRLVAVNQTSRELTRRGA